MNIIKTLTKQHLLSNGIATPAGKRVYTTEVLQHALDHFKNHGNEAIYGAIGSPIVDHNFICDPSAEAIAFKAHNFRIEHTEIQELALVCDIDIVDTVWGQWLKLWTEGDLREMTPCFTVGGYTRDKYVQSSEANPFPHYQALEWQMATVYVVPKLYKTGLPTA